MTDWLQVSIVGPSFRVINRSAMLRLLAVVNATTPAQISAFRYEWSERLQGLNLSLIAASALGEPALALPSRALTAGISYLFRLTVTDTTAPLGQAVSVTEVSVLVNRPPSAGSFSVLPRSVRPSNAFSLYLCVYVSVCGTGFGLNLSNVCLVCVFEGHG